LTTGRRITITTNPIRTAFAVFILATVVVVSLTLLSYGCGGDFLENILVEAHGMLLDILVIGVFILWLNRSGEKSLEIRRYEEEIDDFRGWNSKEAGYRIAGNVKRLNRNGITDIKLQQCHLVKVDLSFVNLTRASLRRTNLSNAFLLGANLSHTNLSLANLRDADLSRACLSGANLSHTCLFRADLSDADLRDANLGLAYLTRAMEWTNEQLAQAESLLGATLPDGTAMTEEAWEEFKKLR
jgi:hypothetical protein